MIAASANPNLVQVGMIRTGCLKTQFNSHYPTRLNGVINQHDFQQSIANINKQISSNKLQIFCAVGFAVFLLGGIALTIAAAATISSIRNSSFSFTILLSIGVGLITTAPIIFLTLGCCIVRYRRIAKMRRAIAEESNKYSTVSTWRLKVNRVSRVGYGNRIYTFDVYHLLIRIRRSANPALRCSRPTSTVPPQSNLPPPPPYPGHPVACCSQCGTRSYSSTAKFCSSCGYQLNTTLCELEAHGLLS